MRFLVKFIGTMTAITTFMISMEHVQIVSGGSVIGLVFLGFTLSAIWMQEKK